MAPRKPKQHTELFVNELYEAVRFVGSAQHGKGDDAAVHCQIRYGQVIASDRTLAAGAPIVEHDLDCCPQTELLEMALARCGAEHSITQQPDSLFVRSGEFSAYVPLCDPAKLTVPIPDAACAPLGDAFRAALLKCGSLVKENAATVLQSCVQLNPRSCVSTNGNVILEAWHGFDFPPVGMLIPKIFVDALVRNSRKKIVSFGFSATTFTVHFEDGCWLRTNLYTENIPNMMSKLVAVSFVKPFPVGFFKQVVDIAKWSEDGRVYIDGKLISSHPASKERTGSELSYPMIEDMQSASYSIASLKLIAKFAETFDDRATPGRTMFFGPNLRGAIAHEQIDIDKPQDIGHCGEITGVCEGKCDGSCILEYLKTHPSEVCDYHQSYLQPDPRNMGPISDEDIPF